MTSSTKLNSSTSTFFHQRVLSQGLFLSRFVVLVVVVVSFYLESRFFHEEVAASTPNSDTAAIGTNPEESLQI